MDAGLLDQAIELLEKANADLEPELLTAPQARAVLERYAKVSRLGDFGVTSVSRKLDDASELARVTGTSIGKARAVVETGKVLPESDELNGALQHGEISLEQATEIAGAESSCRGVAEELVAVAQEKPFHVLRETARRRKLEAEQHQDLAVRQRTARYGRSHSDGLGMVHIHLALTAARGHAHRCPGRGRGGASGTRGKD